MSYMLLGIALKGRSLDHGRHTGQILTAMDPDYVGALSVIICEGTELENLIASGDHQVLSPVEILVS